MFDGHTATIWQSTVYVWGGKDESTTPKPHPSSGAASASTGSRFTFYSNTMFLFHPEPLVTLSLGRLDDMHGGGGGGGADQGHAVSFERVHVTGQNGMTANGTPLRIPRGRAYHTATLYGKYLFIVGGLMDESVAASSGGTFLQVDDRNNNAVLPVFDFEQRTWAFRSTFGDIPCARCHHVAVGYGDTLMVHGGYPILGGGDGGRDVSAEQLSRMQHEMYDVHELHIPTLRWRRISTAQSPALWGHSAIAFNKNVIVFGGVDVVENVDTSSVAVWHQEKRMWRWADFQQLSLKCAMHTAVQDGGTRMIVFGGVSFTEKRKLQTLFEFNLEFGTWRELKPNSGNSQHGTSRPADIPAGRIGHASVAFQNVVFIIGGSVDVEDPADGGRRSSEATNPQIPDRAVYAYNTVNGHWRRFPIVVSGRSVDELNGDPQEQSHEQSNAGGPKLPDWTLNKSYQAEILNSQTGVASPMQGSEWDTTADRVRDTVHRARHIQELADHAARAIQQQQQSGGGTGSNVDMGSQSVGSQRHAGLNQTHHQDSRIGGGGAESADARRVIDHLKNENDTLRQQLEQFREMSAQGGFRNPFEVPIYNPLHNNGQVMPQNDLMNVPGSSNSASVLRGGRLDGAAVLAELLAPRLNINVADPPRSIAAGAGGGAAPQGYMSRTAVSTLVGNSLRNSLDDAPSSASQQFAKNLRAQASLDPMKYLTQTPSVAAAAAAAANGTGPSAFSALGVGLTGILASGPGGRRPMGATAPPPGAQTYDQLLRNASQPNVSMTSNSYPYGSGGGAYPPESQMMPPVPATLAPLLQALAGAGLAPQGGPWNPSSGMQSSTMPMAQVAAAQYQAAGMQLSPPPPQHQSIPRYSRTEASSTQAGPTSPQASTGPSLGALVSGKGSMLSLSYLQ